MKDFVLNEDTYYSDEANKRYMSIHQYFDFAPHMGIHSCEARAMAKLCGEYTEPTTEAQLIGSYVDSAFDGTLNKFKKEHPECFTQKGELKAGFKRAQRMIERCQEDEMFMQFMSGEKQKIFTAYLFGCDWKCKLDSYIPGKCIVDLKTSANIHQSWRVADYGFVCFLDYWGYILQLAVYQKIVEINTGEKLPCFVAAVTKEDEPEIAIIGVDQQSLDHALNEIEMNMPNVLAVKNGETEPIRCERCNFCKRTAKLTKVIHYNDLIFEE